MQVIVDPRLVHGWSSQEPIYRKPGPPDEGKPAGKYQVQLVLAQLPE